jgi:hypothetical protein
MTFVRRFELLDATSLKIIEPFAVKGAGGRLFARVAGRMALYLEDGKMLVIDPALHPRFALQHAK